MIFFFFRDGNEDSRVFLFTQQICFLSQSVETKGYAFDDVGGMHECNHTAGAASKHVAGVLPTFP